MLLQVLIADGKAEVILKAIWNNPEMRYRPYKRTDYETAKQFTEYREFNFYRKSTLDRYLSVAGLVSSYAMELWNIWSVKKFRTMNSRNRLRLKLSAPREIPVIVILNSIKKQL